MRRRVLVVFLVAVGTAGAFAPPAGGQTQEQIDHAFLTAIRDKGVPVKDDDAALELAHATCDLLTNGGSTDDAVQLIVKTEKKWSSEAVIDFGGLALYAYCPQYLPQ